MATHQGEMPGVPPKLGEPQDHALVDTPYMDDVAKNGIPLGPATVQLNAEPARRRVPLSMAHPEDADPPPMTRRTGLLAR